MMIWSGPFVLGFIAGLFVGEVTLAFFLALVRQGSAVAVAEPRPTSNSEVPAQLA
jgi:hypothetical protein